MIKHNLRNKFLLNLGLVTSKVLNTVFFPQKFFGKHAFRELNHSVSLTLMNIILCASMCIMEIGLVMYLIFWDLLGFYTMLDFFFLWCGIVFTITTFAILILSVFYKLNQSKKSHVSKS